MINLAIFSSVCESQNVSVSFMHNSAQSGSKKFTNEIMHELSKSFIDDAKLKKTTEKASWYIRNMLFGKQEKE